MTICIVKNPATSEVVQETRIFTETEIIEKISAGYEAQSIWRKTTAYERAGLLIKWSTIIKQNREELGRLVTIEKIEPYLETKYLSIGF